MNKTYKSLKRDIENVLRTGAGWTEEISEWVASIAGKSLSRQFRRSGSRSTSLRVSSLGTPCERKLWFSTRGSIDPEPLAPHTLNKFIFGDLTEAYLLGLTKAAGHTLEGLQDTVDVCGVRGSRDCVIDGMLFDVKSASSRAFEKFKQNGLRKDDPFGYLSQLSSYLYGSRNDPLVRYKSKAGFLVMDKQFGHITVDIYDLTEELDKKEWEIQKKKGVVASEEIPPRAYTDVPHNKSGNRKLGTNCSYCDYKKICWPNLRGFAYSSGPIFMTHVEEEPRGNVMEIK